MPSGRIEFDRVTVLFEGFADRNLDRIWPRVTTEWLRDAKPRLRARGAPDDPDAVRHDNSALQAKIADIASRPRICLLREFVEYLREADLTAIASHPDFIPFRPG